MSANAVALLDLYNPQKEYTTLNLADLLLARELNHYELMRKPNVVATAVGYYLIRKGDPWPSHDNPNAKKKDRGPRTLGNSEVRSYSWPCILVFVKDWLAEKELNRENALPPAIYLDGIRKVPVCVVHAPLVEVSEEPIRNIIWPTDTIGGGFPLIADVQGEEHVASIGCLVTDGHTTYALTNRHVSGDPGEVVRARIGTQTVRVGVSSEKQLRMMPFDEVYSGLPGDQVRLNLDIGLVRLDDLRCWSAQVYGLGAMGPIVDLGAEDPLLRLIDCPVRAYGCGTGQMRGAIKALFYRYDKKRNAEYVCDFLIGPRDESADFSTHPGDSGTVWMVEAAKDDLRPIAVQWGGHVFSNPGTSTMTPYALATSLASACDLLGVEIVRDWNIGSTEYWGEMGHYSIGAKAAALKFGATRKKLQSLMNNNVDRIGFDDSVLKDKERYSKNSAHYTFVPLADVADDVWRTTRPADANNHFSDMDEPASSGTCRGKSLLQICIDSGGKVIPGKIDPGVWMEYFDGVPGANPGALPFRVWQMYDEMVECLKKGDVAGFLVGAGCMGHYVGDASQPLHISALHHNYPGATSWQHNVHSVYETQMLNEHAADVVAGLNKQLKNKSVGAIQGFAGVTGGHLAACRVVELMVATLSDGGLPRTTKDASNLAKEICDVYNNAGSPADRLKALWTNFGQKTVVRMAEASVCLGEIWATAWDEAGAEGSVKSTAVGPANMDTLKAIYNDKTRYPSMGLKAMIPLLTAGAVPA